MKELLAEMSELYMDLDGESMSLSIPSQPEDDGVSVDWDEIPDEPDASLEADLLDLDFDETPEEAEAGRLAAWEYRQAMLEAVLDYDQKGYLWLPGGYGDDRKPLVQWGGFIQRRPTPRERSNWMGRYYDLPSNPGQGWPPSTPKLMIMTGPMTGLVVVDVDPRHGGDRTIASLHLPDGYRVSTPRGGYHAYFSLPSGVEVANASLPGVDIQCGKLVIAAPSRKPSGRYIPDRILPAASDNTPAPDWLVEEVMRAAQRKTEAGGRSGSKRSTPHSTPDRRATSEGMEVPASPTDWGRRLMALLDGEGVRYQVKPDWQDVTCPFHDDQTASLSINVYNGTWICQAGCGKGGVLDFQRELDRDSPTKREHTARHPSIGEIRSQSGACKRSLHGMRPDGDGTTAYRTSVPCGRCEPCRRADIRERVEYAHDHWPRGVVRRAIRLPEDQWDALGQRLRHHGDPFMKFPAPKGEVAVVTTMREGKRISNDFSQLEKLIQAVPLKARGEGRAKINVTFSAGLRKPVPKKEKGKKNPFRVIQCPEKFDALMDMNGNIIRGSGTNYTFAIPDSPTWESDFGVIPPQRRMKRPATHPVPEPTPASYVLDQGSPGDVGEVEDVH